MKGAQSSVFENNLLEKISRETPFFVFSQQKIKDKFHKFQKCFPGSGIHYAIKANSEPEVLKILFDAGSSFELASKYDLEMLKELKRPADKIVYGTSVKSRSHLTEFYVYGVNKVSV